VTIRFAPSILSADFAELGRDISALERGGADFIHVDVMDGHFVPNISIGLPVVRAIKKVASVPLDVHLMISDPDRYIDRFIDEGADMLSVHVEVLPHLHRTIAAIKSRKTTSGAQRTQAGVVLNPSTPVTSIEEVAADVDFVLVMSVNPGFGGQVFIERSTHKIREIRALLDRAGNRAPVEVDGGINKDTIERVVAAGAEILVAGGAVFEHDTPEADARELKTLAQAAAALSR